MGSAADDLLGPLTGAYLSWLLERSLALHASRILFLSREGAFFLRAWKCMGLQDALPAAHLECSRESLSGILEEEEQAEAFALYLEGFALSGRVVLSDLGWGGTMQVLLTQFSEKRGLGLSFTGLYMGLSENARHQLGEGGLPAEGYLFDALRESRSQRGSFTPEAPFIGLFESLFLEMEGSVTGYGRTAEGEAFPLRAACEFRDRTGVLVPEGRMILLLQEKALENLEKDRGKRAMGREAFGPLKRLGMQPTLEEARLYGRIPFLDEGVCRPLAVTASFPARFFHPLALARDFRRSRWKMGYLRLLLGGRGSWFWLYRLCRYLFILIHTKEGGGNEKFPGPGRTGPSADEK